MAKKKVSSVEEAQAEALVERCQQLREEIGKVIVGQSEVVDQVLIAILARGNCLLEGVPGLAKTLLVRCLSETLSLSFRRIQFTPDLTPSDITGTEIIQEDPSSGAREMKFQPGPIFANLVLADEINRTSPKTQAALLEAMQEHQVTIGQDTYSLQEPFFVLATQNPIEQEGTYPLPEAQRDRFPFQVQVEYPEAHEEVEILQRTTGGSVEDLKPIMGAEEILEAQELVRKVPVPDSVASYIVELVRASRPKEAGASEWAQQMIDWGAGPRACQYLALGAKVRALFNGRTHVTLEDVQELAHPVLRHRVVPTFGAEAEGITADNIVDHLLETVPTKGTAKVL